MEDKIKIAKKVLSKIQKIDRTAVIAGGWCVDQFVKREPKDADIWVLQHIKEEEIKKLLPDCEIGFRFFTNKLTDKRLKSVLKVNYQGVEFDVIHYTPYVLPDQPEFINPVTTFDFGINQCWFDGKGFLGTDLFWEDLYGRTLTFINNEGNIERLEQIIKRRINKLQHKFKGFTVKGLIKGAEGKWSHEGVGEAIKPLPYNDKERKLNQVSYGPHGEVAFPKPAHDPQLLQDFVMMREAMDNADVRAPRLRNPEGQIVNNRLFDLAAQQRAFAEQQAQAFNEGRDVPLAPPVIEWGNNPPILILDEDF